MDVQMNVEQLAAFLQAEFPQVCDDYAVEAVTASGLRLRLITAAHHLRPGGTVSGPAMFGLADVAMYLAVLSRIGPVALAVTTNCSIDFMRKPTAGADIICEVVLHKLGRVLAVGDCLVYSVGQVKPVARATLTYAIPPKGGVK
uniref:PaaI family thioesterase n=1 Tax=Yoonia sp. TaxID=2212373 RepID=UPI004048E1DD|tara:strand:+ start:75721 stop:76152 length:432 start_codon:yes stop_codon:yes gene_type:complete